MKNIITVALLFFNVYCCMSQERVKLLYRDYIGDSQHATENIICLANKTNRIRPTARTIISKGTDELPEGVNTSIQVALDVWESAIISKDIMIQFEFIPIEGEVDILTEVTYTLDNGKLTPQSLFWNENNRGSDDPVDALISINSNQTWNYSHSNTAIAGKNLTTSLLRAIAHVWGFGSSITDGGGYPAFNHRNYSIFDLCIVDSNDKRMSEIRNIGMRHNIELDNYVQPEENRQIYFEKGEIKCQLYSPEFFSPEKTLKFINYPGSLMHYDIAESDKIQQIDDTTLQILHELGWEILPQNILRIVSEDTDESGCVSAYKDVTFSILGYDNGAYDDIYWNITLPLKDGGFEVYHDSNKSLSFSVPAIVNPDKFLTNINGDIYGNVTFSGSINNVHVEANYRISYELKPSFINAQLINIEYINEDYFNADIEVSYRGADKLKIEIEQDYSPSILTDFVDEPFYVIHNIQHINTHFYSWIDLTISNSYGKTIKTIEIEPSITKKTFPIRRDNAESYVSIIGSDIFDIYTLSGKLLMKDVQQSDLNLVSPGLYVAAIKDNNTIIKRKKILIK